MTEVSYARYGGVLLWDNALTRLLATTANCPFGGFAQGCSCPSTLDLPGVPWGEEDPTIQDAPWFDPTLPDLSGRFFGFFAYDVAGVTDTFRSVNVVEGVDDGAWIGRSRRTAREVLVKGILLAQGQDALDYGSAWLSRALDGTHCSQHQESCGVTDFSWFTDCPPERGSDPGFTEWVDAAVNVFTNPSLEQVDDAGTITIPAEVIYSNPLTSGDPTGWVAELIDAGDSGATGASVVAAGPDGSKAVQVQTVGATTSVDPTAHVRATLALPTVVGVEYTVEYSYKVITGAVIAQVSFGTAQGSVTTSNVLSPAEPITFVATDTTTTLVLDAQDNPDITATRDSVSAQIGGITVTQAAYEIPAPGILSGVTPTGCTVAQSDVWAASGTYSMQVTDVTEGATVIFESTVTDGTLLYTMRDPDGLTEDVRVPFTGVPTIVPPVGVETWYDNVGVFEGEYLDAWFDGDTVGDDLTQYAWVGEAGASASVMQTREATEIPWDDATYQEQINPYYRYLHDVVCTSGPLLRADYDLPDWNIREVEFTLTAGRPWVYTPTRYPDLPATSTTVVEDIVHNLVPFTSAEIAGDEDLVVATNYSTNPSVEVDATGWSTALGGGAATAGTVAGGRVTGEIAANGTSSYRSVFTATAAGADGEVSVWQEVDISARPAGAPVSLNMFVAQVLVAGLPVQEDSTVTAVWQDGTGAEISRTEVGSVPPTGGATQLATVTPPDGTAAVRMLAKGNMASWDAATVLRVYVDALVVSVP